MDRIDLDQSDIKRKLGDEIERHKKFHSNIMGEKDEEYRVKDVDIRTYAKYIFTDGTIFEKRDLLECFKSRVLILQKQIKLQSPSL